MAVLNWCKRRNAIEMQVGEITRDMWRGRSANGQIRYRNLVTGATRDDLPQLSRGAIVQPQVGVNNTVVMCEFLASEMAPADLALIVAPPTSREKWKTCSAAHPKLVPAVDPALKTGPNALGGINVVIIGSDDLVPALAGRSAIGTLSWAYLIVDGGDFLADPRQGMNVNAVTRLKAASRWALPAETMRLTKTSVPAICAALKLCPDLYDACSERHLAHLEREIAPTEIPR
ncbi:hypothetical protein EXIGLDRAFT_735704 [Exidia glandulosa HHB12029]|uniref:Uncharacterized protein n=1 Tax=Exidia glandulosa HHB12029 TaxID=1314781 RepID=A0A165PIJ1_EXIGL|nr:hypothetical protein EXIGLDRAFT_735704 [Exidia glandulosa HHB12029]